MSAALTIDASAEGACLSSCPFDARMLCAFSSYSACSSSAKCASRCRFESVIETALGSAPSYEDTGYLSQPSRTHRGEVHEFEPVQLTYLCVLHADEDVRVGGRREVATALGVVEELVLLLLQVDRPRKVLLLRACLVQVDQTCQCVRVSVGSPCLSVQEVGRGKQSDGCSPWMKNA